MTLAPGTKTGPYEGFTRANKVLFNPSYKENAMRISARLKEYGGAPEAARLIENAVKS